jgi:hypothetical protein
MDAASVQTLQAHYVSHIALTYSFDYSDSVQCTSSNDSKAQRSLDFCLLLVAAYSYLHATT